MDHGSSSKYHHRVTVKMLSWTHVPCFLTSELLVTIKPVKFPNINIKYNKNMEIRIKLLDYWIIGNIFKMHFTLDYQ